VWFGSLYGVVGQTTRGVFDGDDKVAEYLISSARAGVDLGATLGTYGTLRAGAQWTQVHARIDTGDPVLPSVKELTAGGRMGFVVDQLDHAWFAQSGYRMDLSYYGATKALGSARNYQRLAGGGAFVKSWGPHTLTVHADGGTDFGSGMPAYESFSLGGPLRMSAYRLNQFAGREYAFGRLMYYNRTVELPELLGSGVFLGGSAEIARVTDREGGLPAAGTVWSASTFLAAITFLGPGYLGVGVGPGRWSLYLLLGAP
jgi:NTE family protein